MSFIISFKDRSIQPLPSDQITPDSTVRFRPCAAIDPTIKRILGRSFAQAAINYRDLNGHPNSVEEFETLMRKSTPDFLELALADSLDIVLAELQMSPDELDSIDLNNPPKELIPIIDAMESFEREIKITETKIKFGIPLKKDSGNESVAILILEEAKEQFINLIK